MPFSLIENSIVLSLQGSGRKLTVLEVGCGVGNFIFPLIQDDPGIFFYACDFSPRAVQFVKVRYYVRILNRDGGSMV